MNENIKVSIIVPVYNTEKYLNNCIKSILKQSHKNIEIIIVDDGSNYKCKELCDAFLGLDSRIIVFHKKNGGLSDARNYGIRKSSGEYLTFVDSDDVVSELYVDILLELALNNNADISVCNCVNCISDNDVKFKHGNKIIVYEPYRAIETMLYQKHFLVSAWCKIYKKQLFNETEFPFGMLYEDSAIMYKLFEKSNKIVYNDSVIYAYFHRIGTITSQRFSIRNYDIVKISGEIYNHYKNNNIVVKSALSYYVVSALRVVLNCDCPEIYKNEIDFADDIITKYGYKVMLDNNARMKTRIGIVLYLYFKPFVKIVYRKIDRWK